MTQWKICIELAEINSVTQPPLPLHNKIQTVIPTNIFINYIEKYKLIFFVSIQYILKLKLFPHQVWTQELIYNSNKVLVLWADFSAKFWIFLSILIRGHSDTI